MVAQEGETRLLRLQNNLPRAWFVNRVERAEQRTILKHLKDGDFDLRDALPKNESGKIMKEALRAEAAST